jgi:Protein of unknown function (DUF4012)
VAEPVLLISSDPFLGASLEAVARGRVRVARLDPSRRPAAWPAGPTTTVVLDVTARQRDALHAWVRRHHPGLVVVVLKPGERSPALPPDPARVVVSRPFRVADLATLLEYPPTLAPAIPGPTPPGPPPPPPPTPGPPPAPTRRPGAGPLARNPEQGPKRKRVRGHGPNPPGSGDTQQPNPPGGAPPFSRDTHQPNPPVGGPPLGRVAEPQEEVARLSTPPTSARPSAPSTSTGRSTPPIIEKRPAPPNAERPAAPTSARRPPPPNAQRPTPSDPARRPPPSAPAPRPTPPTPTQRPVPPTNPGTSPDGPWWAPSERGRRIALRVGVGLLVLLVLAGAWLGFGLLEARQDLLVGAAGVREELARAEVALGRGRVAEASEAVDAARRSVEAAGVVAERRELRAAARLPLLSGGVEDTRRLVAAAAAMTGAGDHAVAVATHLRPGRVALLRDGRFDLDALDDATVQARAMAAELDRVRDELAGVHGGPFAPGVAETRRWALGQVEEAGARARLLVATLEPLPAALGAGGPRRYLVVLTSPAELRPSGGVPLAVREVVVDRGVVRAAPAGGELVEALGAAAGASAHFPTTGRAMATAAAALGRPRPDGVIALDPLAVQALLEATGPVAVPGSGRLDAAGAVRQLTSPVDGRRHQALLAALVTRFLNGRDLVATSRVLGDAGARRNLQVHAADPAVQRMLAGHRLDGALTDPGGGDYLEVHTSNRNRSPVDAFQRRSIRQVVRLAGDGSAAVSRTVRVVNAVPAAGASTRAAAVLATSLPPAAELTSAALDGRPVLPAVAVEQGRPVLRVGVDLPAGRAVSLTVSYRLPRAVAATADGLRYRLTADPQALLDPPVLRVEVRGPPGALPRPADGWTVAGDTATLVRPLSATTVAALDLRG